jgi:hypothetical protein
VFAHGAGAHFAQSQQIALCRRERSKLHLSKGRPAWGLTLQAVAFIEFAGLLAGSATFCEEPLQFAPKEQGRFLFCKRRQPACLYPVTDSDLVNAQQARGLVHRIAVVYLDVAPARAFTPLGTVALGVLA